MERMMVRSKKFTDEKGEDSTLYYWLLSREVLDEEGNGVIAYGVETAQYNGEQLLGQEYVDCISFKKGIMLDFIQSMARGNVTPVTLLSLVDDFISLQEVVGG